MPAIIWVNLTRPEHDTKLLSILPRFVILMPAAIPYANALTLACHCCVGVEFIEEYGLAHHWHNALVDVGELMVFIENKLTGQ